MRPSDFSSTISANFSPALNQVDASPVVTDISSSYVSPPAPSPLASLSSLPHAARKVAKIKKINPTKNFFIVYLLPRCFADNQAAKKSYRQLSTIFALLRQCAAYL